MSYATSLRAIAPEHPADTTRWPGTHNFFVPLSAQQIVRGFLQSPTP